MAMRRYKSEPGLVAVDVEASNEAEAVAAMQLLTQKLAPFRSEQVGTEAPPTPPLIVSTRHDRRAGAVITVSFAIPLEANATRVLSSLVEPDGVPLAQALRHHSWAEEDKKEDTLCVSTRCGDFFLRRDKQTERFTLSFMTLRMREVEAERVVVAYCTAHCRR